MTKRLVDIVVGALLAVILTPVMLLLALGSAISLRAWPFFTQSRVGIRGREFSIVKIRTMPPTAPAYADKYQIAAGVQIPPFCQFLRTHHLDELPQLWLVPLGRMSLVGPRPEMRWLHETFSPEFATLRTSVRPGCSGLWQIGRGASRLIVETPEYDEVYVANVGLRLDVWIMWQTLLMILGFGGERRAAAIPAWAAVSGPVIRPVAPVIRLRDYEREPVAERFALDA